MGWLCPDTANALAERVNAETRLIVECGTWLGVSARLFMQRAPNAELICIDTWMGSPEHWNDKRADGTPGDWASRLPTLYKTCQRNLWPWHDRITMVRQDSLVGLGQVYEAGLHPDLIYLDSKHTAGRVSAELSLCLELFPDARVVMDDYNNAAVMSAAYDHAVFTGRPMIACGGTDAPPAACAFDPWRNV
jgi:hypothetical protein